MPSNKWTQQPALSGATIRAVLAERVYYADADTAFADPVAALDGADPVGWDDFGIVQGSRVQLTYTKEVKPVNTGIEQVRRGSYSMAKSCKAEFTLEQFDIDLISVLSGLTPTAVGAIGNKIHLGQDDVVEKALLFAGVNKVDGKEYFHYTPKCSINWSIDQEEDSRVLKVEADMYAFTPDGETVDAYISLYVID